MIDFAHERWLGVESTVAGIVADVELMLSCQPPPSYEEAMAAYDKIQAAMRRRGTTVLLTEYGHQLWPSQ